MYSIAVTRLDKNIDNKNDNLNKLYSACFENNTLIFYTFTCSRIYWYIYSVISDCGAEKL